MDLKETGYTTCSVVNLKDMAVTYVRDTNWLEKLKISLRHRKEYSIITLAPKGMQINIKEANPHYVDDPQKTFTIYHNWIHNGTNPPEPRIAGGVSIARSVTIGVDAMKYIYDPVTMDEPIQMKHIGGVIIKTGVKIFPYVTIHRGALDDTVINENVAIGAYCNIGHNVVIEKNTALTPYVCVGGSAYIGEGCVIGMGTVIRDGVRIASGVKIGMGSLVVKHITEPGLYFGSPVERKGDWNGEWHK